MRRRDLLKAFPLLATPALAQGNAKTLRFVPAANLSTLDPVWTTATVAIIHAYLIYDTLYGINLAGECLPQMCAGHEVSSDELTWTFTLRDGLVFHDKEKVQAQDCVMSVLRWVTRDPFGQQMMLNTNEIVALDSRRFQVRLKKPFRQMLYGFGSRNCFIMPQRVARTPASEQIKEAIGSGPYRFLPDEWVSGARAVYARYDGYVPRTEKPDYFSGGKAVNFDRVEWIVQPDPSTAAASLQKGETDWVETPLIDLCPMLRKSPGVLVKVNDPYGWQPILAMNHLYPPFDNQKLREALLPAIDQHAFVEAMIGDQADLGRVPAGYFTEGRSMATHAGLEALSGPRDLGLAKKLVAESGYKGGSVLLMAASDQPTLMQLSQVTRELFLKVGLTVDYQVMDWGSLVTRRANQSPPDQGGWNAFNTLWGGLTVSNPGSSYPLRGSGKKAWFGWPTDGRLESLREAWFDAPDLATQKAIAAQIQLRALETVPYIPLGQIFQPTAYRSDIKDVVPAAIPLFWGVRRG
jgi:peptide/nickel transport system substrate-binding protein